MSRTIQHESSTQARSKRDRDDMTRRQHSIARARRTALWIGALIAAVVFGGCRRDPERQPELEAVDVGPALEIATDDDPKEIERPPELIGILPADFPRDLPLYLPASLIEFGTADDGWVFVDLLTPHAPATVERELSKLLAERGWTSSTATSGARQLRKGGTRARLRVENARPGTRYRYAYPP